MSRSFDRNQYLTAVQKSFAEVANPEIAKGQEAYMKHRFKFLGIKSPIRNTAQKEFLLKANKPPKEELSSVVRALWETDAREYQYCAQELAGKYLKQSEASDLILFEHMVTNKSWWDTVDFIASTLIGNYFQCHPDLIRTTIEKWLRSQNMWLQRTCILFQLKYKRQLDPELVSYIVEWIGPTKEFFLNKAIGWILREYSKTHPEWVIDYVDRTELSNLSKREALKWMKNKASK